MFLLSTLPALSAALLATPHPEPAPALMRETPSSLGSLRAQDLDGEASRFRMTLEAGAVFSNRNDVRSPGDTGTRFSLNDLTGEGPWPVGRITFEYDLDEKHGLRFLYAPVRTDGTGELKKNVVFENETFNAGRASADYQFDTYRLAYRYRFWETEAWTWRGGVTALVRDASIEVSQGGRSASKTDLGVVPLLNLTGEWRFADRWVSVLDVEGSAAPQGRAFDVALTVGYDVRPGLRASLGYRTIEGGADNDEVYTFTWVNSAIASLRWSL
ncbi:hypothetical protein Poly30_10470 [Planctomycetes bacterium Poly30]|uniref:DUF481 domain-containing protein n=1 Tax=Saltatorellus ferox TaxID=2528018 RepID=A0A518EN92_9BACT|nr:hypothetical protein Poly30_10470 [Planctomycetes bacterium Poly30]